MGEDTAEDAELVMQKESDMTATVLGTLLPASTEDVERIRDRNKSVTVVIDLRKGKKGKSTGASVEAEKMKLGAFLKKLRKWRKEND
jgi:hypothetical protein